MWVVRIAAVASAAGLEEPQERFEGAVGTPGEGIASAAVAGP